MTKSHVRRISHDGELWISVKDLDEATNNEALLQAAAAMFLQACRLAASAPIAARLAVRSFYGDVLHCSADVNLPQPPDDKHSGK